MKPQWTATTEEAENGDLILPFPEDMIEQCGWLDGDELDFTMQEDGTCIIVNLTKNDRGALPGNIE